VHELSIACSLVEAVLDERKRLAGKEVRAVLLRLGPLSGVVREALLFCFGVATEGTPLEGAELRIEEVPVVVYCPACGCDRTLPTPEPLCCPVCGAPTPEIRQGREIEVFGVEVVDGAPDR
jgi:hydrogenase nickel incorporation protein HypA/HybF